MLEHKIDFIVTFEVKEANANGDPLNGNMPRTDAKGYGVMSDVSIKRKIRNRLQDMGKPIFVQVMSVLKTTFVHWKNAFRNILQLRHLTKKLKKKQMHYGLMFVLLDKFLLI